VKREPEDAYSAKRASRPLQEKKQGRQYMMVPPFLALPLKGDAAHIDAENTGITTTAEQAMGLNR
jgi:hypothetical protein